MVTVSLLVLLPLLFLGVRDSAFAAGPQDGALLKTIRMPRMLDDFYTAANYRWLTETPPPYTSFQEVSDRTTRDLFRLVRRTALKVERGAEGLSHVEEIVGKWYLSGIDVRARHRDGLGPLKGIFKALRTVQNKGELAGMLAGKGIDVFFDVVVYVDVAAESLPRARLYIGPSENVLVPPDLGSDSVLRQCGKASIRSVQRLCRQVLEGVTKVFQKLGDSPADAQANAEHVIAAVSVLAARARTDFLPLSLDETTTAVPGFDIRAFFKALAVDPEVVMMFQSAWFPIFAGWFRKVSPEGLSAYLRWRVLAATYKYLDDDISHIVLNFTSPLELRDRRTKRVFATMNDDPFIALAVGQLFSSQLLDRATYTLVHNFIETIRQTFRLRIQSLAWMQAETRAEALLKIDAFRFFIGAPRIDVFRGLVVTKDSYINNGLRAMEFQRRRYLNSVDMPEFQKAETFWGGLPQEVNAYYIPTRNSIYINAAILQPPFFNPRAVDEINFGAIGSIIGHEMSHGFDNTGRQYDHNGIKRDWWTPDDDRDFLRISSALKAQFNNYTYFGRKLDGTLTLGENIADLGGVAISYNAWKRTRRGGGLALVKDISTKKKYIPRNWRKYTPPQRFFLSLARMWREIDTRDDAIASLKVSQHSPHIFRCNGPASNLAAFYHAFNLRKGYKMYREPSKRVTIW